MICTQFYSFKYSYLIQIICTVIWYQIFLSNTNNLHMFYGFKYTYPILIINSVGNRFSNPSSNPGWGWLHFTYH